jgi:hypothetical protein
MSTPFPSAQAFEEMFEYSRRLLAAAERDLRYSEARDEATLDHLRRSRNEAHAAHEALLAAIRRIAAENP